MSTQRNSTEYVYINGQKVPKSQITYTDGGQATNTGVYPMSTYGASGSVSSASSASPTPTTPNVGNSGYTYVPGSAAPTNGNVMDYATWLQGNTKYQAGQMREQAVKQAESDRQRAIVDANSSYAQNQALYGANAENMASMGLSSSGYGEYLTGKAYATQRADVQKANAAAQARKDQVLYEEGQMKINADKEYAEMLISFRDKTNSQYQSDYNSALNGTSLEAIMQSGSWNDYTPEQQATIRGATIANGLRLQIDGGSTIDDIINNPSSGWNNITVSQQQELKNYYSNKAANQFTAFSAAIKNGSSSLDEIKAMPGYANLSPDQVARLEEAAQGVANDNAYKDILADAERGDYTAESVLNAEGYANLSEAQKDDILDAIKDYEEAEKGIANDKAYKDIIADAMRGDYTAESVLNAEGYANLSEAQKDDILDAIKDYEEIEKGIANDNAYKDILADAERGDYTAESVLNAEGYANLSEAQKDDILDAIKDYEEAEKGIASDKAYKDILADAMRGDYTAESVLNAEGYANLSEAQKDDILDAINEKAYKDILDGIQSGEYTAESVQSVDGYQNLNSSQKNAIDLAIKTYQDGRQASEDTTFLEMLGRIKNGSLRYDDMKNTSLVKGLNPDLIKQLESAQAAYYLEAIRQNIDNGDYTNFSDLMGTEYYKKLSEPNKITVKGEFVLSVAGEYPPDLDKKSVEDSLKGKRYSTSEIKLVVGQWQDLNLQDLIDSGETFYADEIEALIGKGAIPANSDQILRQKGQLDTLNGAQGPTRDPSRVELTPNDDFDLIL